MCMESVVIFVMIAECVQSRTLKSQCLLSMQIASFEQQLTERGMPAAEAEAAALVAQEEEQGERLLQQQTQLEQLQAEAQAR